VGDAGGGHPLPAAGAGRVPVRVAEGGGLRRAQPGPALRAL